MILTFDVGGTFIKYGLMNDLGEISQTNKVATPRESFTAFLAEIRLIVADYSQEIKGLAFSLPGTIDSEQGIIYQGGSLQYHNGIEFVKKMETEFGFPTTIENDARCAALAEMWKGNLKGIDDAVVIVFGTGVGGAIIKNGEIHKGKHLYAGEFSLIFTKDLATFKKDAVFGEQGSIPNFVQKVSKLKRNPNLTGEAVFKLIEEQDTEVLPLFADYLKDVVPQLFNLQMIYDPEQIIIGGGISRNSFFIHTLNIELKKFYQQLPITIPHSQLLPCKHDNRSNLIGAGYHFKKLHVDVGIFK